MNFVKVNTGDEKHFTLMEAGGRRGGGEISGKICMNKFADTWDVE